MIVEPRGFGAAEIPIFESRSVYQPVSHRPMHVAAFGSGSGTIVRAMLAAQKKSEKLCGTSPFAIKLLYTDRECRFQEIAKEEHLPLVYHPYLRNTDYNQMGLELLLGTAHSEGVAIDLLLLAGYMRLLTSPWLLAFPFRILNIHPADLTICLENGRRKFIGANAVFHALQEGQTKTRTSAILIDESVDGGPILVSGPWVDYHEGYPVTKEKAARHQEKQKALSDWPACLQALELIALGRAAILPETKTILIDGIEQPRGGLICAESWESSVNSRS